MFRINLSSPIKDAIGIALKVQVNLGEGADNFITWGIFIHGHSIALHLFSYLLASFSEKKL